MGNFCMFNRLIALLVFVMGMVCIAQQKTYAAPCPCDILQDAGSPCVAAHSTVRALFASYTGPLYQVRRSSDNAVKDIPQLADGVADASVQDSFLGTTSHAGVAQDSIDDKIQANIVAAGYGRTTTANWYIPSRAKTVSIFTVHYNPSTASAIVSYTLQYARRVSMGIFNQQGRQIAAVASGFEPAGRCEAVWDAKRVPAGVYVARMAFDGRAGWAGRIIIEK